MGFYLRGRPEVTQGAVLCAVSPWLVVFIPQAQFWPGDYAHRYGDGTVRDKLSVIIGDWTTPSVIYGKPARELPRRQIAREIWEQMKRGVNKSGQAPRLREEMLHSWNIDPAAAVRHSRPRILDRLCKANVGTERYRRSRPGTGGTRAGRSSAVRERYAAITSLVACGVEDGSVESRPRYSPIRT